MPGVDAASKNNGRADQRGPYVHLHLESLHRVACVLITQSGGEIGQLCARDRVSPDVVVAK